MNAAEKSIVVNAPVAQVYEQWLRFEAPEVHQIGLGTSNESTIHISHSSLFEAGRKSEVSSEVARQIPERKIAWRTIGESVGLGVVSF